MVDNIIITKEHLIEYRRCQGLGLFNMLDYNSWSQFTTLSKDAWYKIIKNYNTYFKKYY